MTSRLLDYGLTVRLQAGDDSTVRLQAGDDLTVRLQAGDDLTVRLQAGDDLTLNIRSVHAWNAIAVGHDRVCCRGSVLIIT